MGYIRDGRYIDIRHRTTLFQLEIGHEVEKAYEHRFGRKFTTDRFNNQLSSWEQNDIILEASKRVQDRRKGRLIE